MGLILAAMAGAGDSAVKSIDQATEQRNKLQAESNQADLQLRNQIALDQHRIATAVSERAQLASRIAPPQSELDKTTLMNATNDPEVDWVSGNTQLNSDGTAPDNATRVSPSMDSLSSADRAQYQASQKQQLAISIQQAIKSGDISTANELQKMLDSGKVSVGYGGTVVDQNDIDPNTGRPRVLIDNSGDRTAVGMANAGARQTNADANMQRADTYQQRADSGGSKPLTGMQLAKNKEIDVARAKVADLSEQDIKLMTSKFTASGRANPAYDQQLAARLKIAGQRKIGDDPVFDSALDSSNSSSQGGNAVLDRFAHDSSMAGMRPGRATPNGVEVFDKTGRLVGHYR
jgi:hypothetical protein